MTYRVCVRLLKDAGWIHKRTRGGHEVWKSPQGRIVPIPCHPGAWRSGNRLVYQAVLRATKTG